MHLQVLRHPNVQNIKTYPLISSNNVRKNTSKKCCHVFNLSIQKIRRPGSACTVFFSYVASKILSQGAHPKSPVQNPKSKIPKIQNPQNPKSPNSKIQTLHIKICYIMFQKSKIQNPQNPKSPKSQKPKSPQSKIQNPQNPKSKIPKIQNPAGFWGFWILDLGFRPQNPKSKLPKIQNPQNPKSSAEIQNLGRWGPHVKNCFLMMQNPKSKIPKIRPKKLGFWILGILYFGFWGFWILDFGDFVFWDFGFWGFWILGILDFGILGILDFGIWGILDFWIWGRSRGCTTRQFGDGAWRSEARIPPGLPLRATSKPTVSNRVGARKQIDHFFRGQSPTKSQKNPDFQPRGQNFTNSQKNLDFQPTSKQI